MVSRPPKGSTAGDRRAASKRARRSAGGKAPAGRKEADGGVGAFVRGLTETERVALIVRDELFAGSWESYRKDLEARAGGRPYVFKLASRIEDDLRAVEKLSRFERRHEVNLADYLGEGR